jgi:hypothetical protein
MTEELKQQILRNCDSGEISRVAAEGGMRSMFEDGLRKVVAGVTTLEEVLRVTQEHPGAQQLFQQRLLQQPSPAAATTETGGESVSAASGNRQTGPGPSPEAVTTRGKNYLTGSIRWLRSLAKLLKGRRA